MLSGAKHQQQKHRHKTKPAAGYLITPVACDMAVVFKYTGSVVFKYIGSNAVVDINRFAPECITLVLHKPGYDIFDEVESATRKLQQAVDAAVAKGAILENSYDHWRSVRLDVQTSQGIHELTINPVLGFRPAYGPCYPFQKHRDAAIKAWKILCAAVQESKTVVILVSQYSRVDCALSDILFTQRSEVAKFMQKLPLHLQQNKRLIAKALDINGMWLEFCPESTKKCIKHVLLALETCPHAFQFAAQELKESKDAVLAAVQVNGDAYMHAAPVLQRDRDVVLAACCKSRKIAMAIFLNSDPAISCFAHDRTVALAAMKALTCSLFDFRHFQNDKELVLEVVAFKGTYLKGASTPLKDSDDVVAAAIGSNALALRYASARLKACLKTATLAVMKDKEAIKYVDISILSDPNFWRQ